MTQKRWRQFTATMDQWISTRRHLAQPATLRLWPTPNQFDKYFSRVILLATLGSVLYLFGCNSASIPSGTEYIGDWENAHVPGVITTIRQQGDQFIVHHPNGTDSLAMLKNGLLQFEGGGFYMYHKDANTITSSGNSQYLLRRKK